MKQYLFSAKNVDYPNTERVYHTLSGLKQSLRSYRKDYLEKMVVTVYELVPVQKLEANYVLRNATKGYYRFYEKYTDDTVFTCYADNIVKAYAELRKYYNVRGFNTEEDVDYDFYSETEQGS
jgi:hypothetical protein